MSAEKPDKTPPDSDTKPEDVDEGTELEPFHLDDTELANRLVRDRGLIHYNTPPHTRLMFPNMVQP